MLDLAGVLVDNHELAFVAPSCRLLCHAVLGQEELELR